MGRTAAACRVLAPLTVVVLVLAVGTPVLGQARPPANPPAWMKQPLTDELVRQAIQRGVDYLWTRQDKNDFHWEPQTTEDWRKWVQANPNNRAALTIGGMHGGFTALALMGLLRAGVSPDDERFDKAVKWLIEQPMNQTYPRAMRAVLLASLGAAKVEQRKALEADKLWLLEAMYGDGTYGYFAPPDHKTRMSPAVDSFGSASWRDLSNTQYGVLGMWLLSDAGLEAPAKYWSFVQNAFVTTQNPDGSWPYSVAKSGAYGKSSQSMTLAGLASLFVAWDKTCGACNAQPNPDMVKAINRGLIYLGKTFNPAAGGATVFANQFQMYTLYGVERVGVASGLKYFGEHNWWDEAARYALARQQKDGSWPSEYPAYSDAPVATSYALLFLSFGRAPIVFNKLAYGDERGKLSVEENAAQWNARPRDLARLTIWINRTTETLHNWQIMPIDKPVEELLDAPILQLSGRAPLSLPAEHKLKLRQYVQGGGLLLGEAVDNSKPFADSFRAMIRELFPELEMRPLSESDLLYTLQYKLKKPGTAGGPPALEGLSNGVRTLVVLSSRDLGCVWQQFAFKSAQSYFELAGNLINYVSDRGKGLLGRGASYMTRDLGKKPARSVTVGRLVWGGSRYYWDPEPAGWPRMDVALRNADLAGVTTRDCDLSAAGSPDPAEVPILHVTGTTPFALTDQQKANLKKYVAAGGTLLADAAGGSKPFADSFTKLAEELFGPLSPASPAWLAQATDANGEVQLRHFEGLPRVNRKLNLLGARQGERWAVLFLPCDLTAALVGYPNFEPAGLTPQSAEKFVAAMIASPPAGTATKP